MKELRIAIVGMGGIGHTHLAGWKQVPHTRVVAFCVHRSAPDGEIPSYTDLSELLAREKPDIVDICTPTDTHPQLVMTALQGGADVICEKPAALTAELAQQMCRCAAREKRHLYFAQVMRFTKEFQFLSELVHTNRYGPVTDASFWRLAQGPQPESWFAQKERSGQLLYDLHIHDLDMIAALFGAPEAAQLYCAQASDNPCQEIVRADYSYPGFRVHAEAAWYRAPLSWTAGWRVCFRDAVLDYDGKRMLAYENGGAVQSYDLRDEVLIDTGINVPPCGWYYNELAHFAACVRENIDSPVVPNEQIVAVLRILQRAAQPQS